MRFHQTTHNLMMHIRLLIMSYRILFFLGSITTAHDARFVFESQVICDRLAICIKRVIITVRGNSAKKAPDRSFILQYADNRITPSG
jgi:hypothetical protein